MKIRDHLYTVGYRLRRWVFRWVTDSEGDLGLEILGIVTLLKYKDSCLVIWFARYPNAPKYLKG